MNSTCKYWRPSNSLQNSYITLQSIFSCHGMDQVYTASWLFHMFAQIMSCVTKLTKSSTLLEDCMIIERHSVHCSCQLRHLHSSSHLHTQHASITLSTHDQHSFTYHTPLNYSQALSHSLILLRNFVLLGYLANESVAVFMHIKI